MQVLSPAPDLLNRNLHFNKVRRFEKLFSTTNHNQPHNQPSLLPEWKGEYTLHLSLGSFLPSPPAPAALA